MIDTREMDWTLNQIAAKYTEQILIMHSPGGGLQLCIMRHYAQPDFMLWVLKQQKFLNLQIYVFQWFLCTNEQLYNVVIVCNIKGL